MVEWEDVRYSLAVAHDGSVRAGADHPCNPLDRLATHRVSSRASRRPVVRQAAVQLSRDQRGKSSRVRGANGVAANRLES